MKIQKPVKLTMQMSFAELTVVLEPIGYDMLVHVSGGEKPHIGCVVLAVPRASLTGNGQISTTSSVINVTGHKDEEICRAVAEKVCRTYSCTCVCTGGFHIDHITKAQLKELCSTVDALKLPEGV